MKIETDKKYQLRGFGAVRTGREWTELGTDPTRLEEVTVTPVAKEPDVHFPDYSWIKFRNRVR